MSVSKALAEGINGYIRGMQIRRGMDREDEERAFREEQRDNARADRARQDDERRQLADAYRPVEVQEGAGGGIKPETMDNRDVGQPGEAAIDTSGGQFMVDGQRFTGRAQADAAAATANTTEAQDARAAKAYRRIGKPGEAAQLESAQAQAKASKFRLEKDQEEWVNKQFDTRLGQVTDATQIADLLSGSPLAGGRKVTAAPSEDGKTVDLIAHTEDGQTVKLTRTPIENSEAGIKKAIVSFSKSMDVGAKVTAMQHFAQFDESRRQFEANEAQQERHFNANKDLQREQIGISRGHLGVAQEGLRRQREKDARDPDLLLPPAVKLSVGAQDRVIQGIEKAITDAQARGEWDDKSEGAKQLRMRLVKAQEARDGLMAPFLNGGGAAAAPAGGKDDYMGFRRPAPGAAQSAPAARPTLTMPARTQEAGAGPAPAPAAAPAAPFQPVPAMEQRVAAEQAEMGAGSRMQYTPEVKAYLQAKQAAQQQSAIAEGDAYRQEELRRAQERARTVIPR